MSAGAVNKVVHGLSSLIAILIIPAGCATWQPPTDTSDASLRSRATTETSRDVKLSAAVLSGEDSLRMFGIDVNATGVQPVWIEVSNASTQSLWLLRSGTDPDYFSPLEVAWSAHATFGGKTNDRIDEHFDRLAFRSPIPPGRKRSGVLFTNPQPITKLLNVDLLGDRTMIPFTLFVPVPGESLGSFDEQHIHEYADAELTRYDDEASLRRAIEALSCCTVSTRATTAPINVVLIGRLADIGAAMTRRGYRRESIATNAGQQMFGRAPDLVVRKRAQAGASANWLRMWLAPFTLGEQVVFVAQAGRPVGGRFAKEQDEDRMHPDVDEVRNLLIQDLLYSGGLEKFGFAYGGSAATEAAGYHTDGLRAVLFFATRPLTFDDVRVLDWVSLAHAAEATTAQPAGARR